MRAFIGIEFPSALQPRVRELQQQLAAQVRGDVAWHSPDRFHLTLFFLGEIIAQQQDALMPALAEVALASQPLSLSVRGLGAFPDWRRPRVLWLGLHEQDGHLAALQRRVVAAVAALGFTPDFEKFQPHLSLGYVQRKDRLAPQRVGLALRHVHVGELGAMPVNALVLFESRSGAHESGTRYIPLASYSLAALE